MKWILLALIFAGGVYYMVAQKKAEEEKKVQIEQIKKEEIKNLDPDLPVVAQNDYVMKFSRQTLVTLRLLTEDTNEKVRLASIELLWQLQDEQSPYIIKRMFEMETEASIKKKLIEMVAKDKTKMSLKILSEALKNYDKDTRIEAAAALGDFTSKDGIIILNDALKDYDEEVRLKSLESINKIKKNIELHREEKLRELSQPKPIFKVE
ncbi:MAG: hypothetical protein COT17_07455 [Elusimicrobia bacterium CG08_land_8_20_14_0_20_51_18]|nr:MAG: hypothetical protein COT17_07455 [Elusimicrobia bacterium CG08_land_8_20_14_0_20_51_18]